MQNQMPMGNKREYPLTDSGGGTPRRILVEGEMGTFTQYPNSQIDSKPELTEADDVPNALLMSINGDSHIATHVDDAPHFALKSHIGDSPNIQVHVGNIMADPLTKRGGEEFSTLSTVLAEGETDISIQSRILAKADLLEPELSNAPDVPPRLTKVEPNPSVALYKVDELLQSSKPPQKGTHDEFSRKQSQPVITGGYRGHGKPIKIKQTMSVTLDKTNEPLQSREVSQLAQQDPCDEFSRKILQPVEINGYRGHEKPKTSKEISRTSTGNPALANSVNESTYLSWRNRSALDQGGYRKPNFYWRKSRRAYRGNRNQPREPRSSRVAQGALIPHAGDKNRHPGSSRESSRKSESRRENSQQSR
jgi:hypothetical protein